MTDRTKTSSVQDTKKRARDSLLVSGFVHHYHCIGSSSTEDNNNQTALLTTNVPNEIMDLCLLYYYLNIHELAWSMTTQWDAWDLSTIHPAMSVSNDSDRGGTQLSRGAQGTNPFSFGTQSVHSGVTLWRFELIAGLTYWYGICSEANVRKNSSSLDGHRHVYTMYHSYLVNAGDRCCLCLEYDESPDIGDADGDADSDNDAVDAHATTATNTNRQRAKLSISGNGSEFVVLEEDVDCNPQYRMCFSMRDGGKVNLLASTHIE